MLGFGHSYPNLSKGSDGYRNPGHENRGRATPCTLSTSWGDLLEPITHGEVWRVIEPSWAQPGPRALPTRSAGGAGAERGQDGRPRDSRPAGSTSDPKARRLHCGSVKPLYWHLQLKSGVGCGVSDFEKQTFIFLGSLSSRNTNAGKENVNTALPSSWLVSKK